MVSFQKHTRMKCGKLFCANFALYGAYLIHGHSKLILTDQAWKWVQFSSGGNQNGLFKISLNISVDCMNKHACWCPASWCPASACWCPASDNH